MKPASGLRLLVPCIRDNVNDYILILNLFQIGGIRRQECKGFQSFARSLYTAPQAANIIATPTYRNGHGIDLRFIASPPVRQSG